MGILGAIFGGGGTKVDSNNTVNVGVNVDPKIAIEFDFNSAGEQISTVISESAVQFNDTLDNALKTVSAIALLAVIGFSLRR